MKIKNLGKRSLAAAMAALMVLGTGCGNKAPEQAPAGTDATAGAAGATQVAADDLYGDEVDITVMVWDRGNAAPNTTTEDNALTQWIQQQMKELYNINVSYVSVPRSESDDKVNIMMSGGTAPNIILSYSQDLFYNYASSGALKDITTIYQQYGGNIQQYCGEAQSGIADLGDQKFAVMKQRGTENARHTAYIRKDWLDQLGMDVPKTKEELGKYLYAVKEAGLGTPWGMSGRADTEKMYLNFVGSYVDLTDDKMAYTYAESYMAVAPGSKDGLKQLNQWYNDGLITQDFPTDTDESVFLADLANGKIGFTLDDTTHVWDPTAVLNTTLGAEDASFIPIQCFDCPDGSYRTPYEYRYAMFVMIPEQTTTDEQAVACMKYLNWLADPANAVQVRYTPDLTYDELGVANEPVAADKEAKGYPGTCDDLCIMNLNFDWVNDYDTMSKSMYASQEQDWASEAWYKNYYDVCATGKYRFPVYGYVSEEQATYGTDIKNKMLQFVYTCICCPADQFEATYENGYNELVNSGLQKILDARAAYYDSVN